MAAGMECDTIKALPYEELKLYTNNFSEDNLIGEFQWGNVYRGYNGAQEVTVKKWEEDIAKYLCLAGQNEDRLKEEILLLQHSEMRTHPNLVKSIGYCCVGGNEDQLGIVYDLNPLDSVENLVPKAVICFIEFPDSFTWLQRIKVILRFASILESMHSANPPNLPYLIRNISAAHIMVGQDYNPKLFDFGMISGGIFPDRRRDRDIVFGCYGYINFDYRAPGGWSEKVDTNAFGRVVLMLISKKMVPLEDGCGQALTIDEWAQDACKPKGHLVHKNLIAKPGFYARDGRKLTKLAISCTDYLVTMKEVIKRLLSLRAVRYHADFLGVNQILRSHNRLN